MAPPRGGKRWSTPGFALHWAMLFLFWIVLSGVFDAFHLVCGVLSTAVVARLTHEMQFFEGRGELGRLHLARVSWPRLFVYVLWLTKEIAVANLQVLRVVLDPKLPIDPAMVSFKTHLQSDLGRTLLANSITLTPGTITVTAPEGEFLVHALVADPGVLPSIGRMQEQIARTLPGIEEGPVE